MSETHPLIDAIEERVNNYLNSVDADKGRLREDANAEERVQQSGYRDRQLVELIQNALDAQVDADLPAGESRHRITVRLEEEWLFVANTGRPFGEQDVGALLAMHVSDKGAEHIGRFGVGFKSVGGISSEQHIYADGVQIALGRAIAKELLSSHDLPTEHVPCFRMARTSRIESDRTAPAVRQLHEQHDTVIALRLLNGRRGAVAEQMRSFPGTLLLIADRPVTLTFIDAQPDPPGSWTVDVQGDPDRPSFRRLLEGRSSPRCYRRFSQRLDVPDEHEEAGGKWANVVWLVPEEGREPEPLHVYFPLDTASPLPGILHADFITTQERKAADSGALFNLWLASQAGELCAEWILEQSDATPPTDDPCRTLDFVPPNKRYEDELRTRFVRSCHEALRGKLKVAAADCSLKPADELRPHPEGITFQVATQWLGLAVRAGTGASTAAAYVHPSVLRHRRRDAFEAIGGETAAELTQSIVAAWIEPMNSRQVPVVQDVIRFVVSALEDGHLPQRIPDKQSSRWGPAVSTEVAAVLRDAINLPCADGESWRAASEARLHDESLSPRQRDSLARWLVHPEFEREVRKELEAIGVQPASAADIEVELRERSQHPRDQDGDEVKAWEEWWSDACELEQPSDNVLAGALLPTKGGTLHEAQHVAWGCDPELATMLGGVPVNELFEPTLNVFRRLGRASDDPIVEKLGDHVADLIDPRLDAAPSWFDYWIRGLQAESTQHKGWPKVRGAECSSITGRRGRLSTHLPASDVLTGWLERSIGAADDDEDSRAKITAALLSARPIEPVLDFAHTSPAGKSAFRWWAPLAWQIARVGTLRGGDGVDGVVELRALCEVAEAARATGPCLRDALVTCGHPETLAINVAGIACAAHELGWSAPEAEEVDEDGTLEPETTAAPASAACWSLLAQATPRSRSQLLEEFLGSPSGQRLVSQMLAVDAGWLPANKIWSTSNRVLAERLRADGTLAVVVENHLIGTCQDFGFRHVDAADVRFARGHVGPDAIERTSLGSAFSDVADAIERWASQRQEASAMAETAREDESFRQRFVERWLHLDIELGSGLGLWKPGDDGPAVPLQHEWRCDGFELLPDGWPEIPEPNAVLRLDQSWLAGKGASRSRALARLLANEAKLPAGVGDHLRAQDQERAHHAIRETKGVVEKLQRIVALAEARCEAGASTEPLRGKSVVGFLRDLLTVPGGIIDHGEDATAAELVRGVFALRGAGTLEAIRDLLTVAGLGPPRSWRGSAEAVGFVESLGFPAWFAGGGKRQRAAHEVVHGPPSIGPLHGFQVEAAYELAKLLDRTTQQAAHATNDSMASRAMLCLPTGAGKTRVTLQTLVQWLYSVPENENEDEPPTEEAVAHPMSRGALRARPGATVLWCADRKELCEQAALTTIDAWRAFGPKGAELHVHRLFDGRSTPQLRTGESVFVVATMQSLNRRADDGAVARLFEAADCVVIDEGHKSAARTYRTLIDASVQARARRGLPSPAVLGLSATPFRSDDAESRALARLFGERLIPGRDEQVPLRSRLREDGTLAKPRWEEIDAPAKRALTEEELSDLAKIQHAWLPESVITWLAGQVDNDQPVVDKIKELLDRDEAPVLVFTGNVDQARRLARTIALDLGVTAGAVDGESKFHVRQHAYEALRSGELGVLCNCALLTTGFDAPKVRSVVIARPVLSRVLFQQMVGRGLRGPKNGGTNTCTIVTARYDIPELKRELLFREEQLDSWR